MKTIQLRPLAISSLSFDYARMLDENTIVHYRVPMFATLATDDLSSSAADPVSMVTEHIKAQEGSDTRVEFLPHLQDTLPGKPLQIGSMVVKDVSDDVLSTSPELLRSLDNLAAKSLVVKHSIDLHPIKRRTLGRIFNLVNKLIVDPINRVVERYKLTKQHKEHIKTMKQLYADGCVSQEELDYALMEGPVSFSNIPALIQRLPTYSPVEQTSYVHYLTIGFESSQYELAKHELLADLQILNAHDLIMGHLAKPFVLTLADATGDGKLYGVLGAYVVIDSHKAKSLIPNYNPQALQLNTLGVKHESNEYEMSYLNGQDPRNKYAIQVEVVNPAAKANQKLIDEIRAEEQAHIDKKTQKKASKKK